MGRWGSYGTASALESDADRLAMWMRRLRLRIAEKIVGEAEQSAQSFG